MTVVAERPQNGRVWKEDPETEAKIPWIYSLNERQFMSYLLAVFAVVIMGVGWVLSQFQDESISKPVSADLFHVAPEPWFSYLIIAAILLAIASIVFGIFSFKGADKRNRLISFSVIVLMAGVGFLGLSSTLFNIRFLERTGAGVGEVATTWLSETVENKIGESVSNVEWASKTRGSFEADGVEYSFMLSEKSDGNFYLSALVRNEELTYDAPK